MRCRRTPVADTGHDRPAHGRARQQEVTTDESHHGQSQLDHVSTRGLRDSEARRRISWRSDSACSRIELGTTKAGVSTFA